MPLSRWLSSQGFDLERLRFSLRTALAVVAGPLLALIAFRLIFPTNARRRQRHLEAMMLHELENLASRGDSQREALWQARLYHRVMRLVHWAHLQGEATHRVVDASLAALTLGETLEALRHYSQEQGQNQADPGTRRRLEACLRRIARLRQAPLEAAAALERLERLVRTLARRQQVELARQARHAATLLRENRAFFQGKA